MEETRQHCELCARWVEPGQRVDVVFGLVVHHRCCRRDDAAESEGAGDFE
jgi:hypothetical protein